MNARATAMALDERRPFQESLVQPKTYRLVALNHGKVVKVDALDFDFARSMPWCWTKKGYARRDSSGRQSSQMHRVIMERALGRRLLPTEDVDHKNRDKLDNRRSNLRVATRTQNNANMGLRSTNLTGYRGISKRHRKWYVAIRIEGITVHVPKGFTSAEEAAYVYDQFAIQLYGEYAGCNVL